ncbi:hypothetical protein CO038_00935 [Candidatus Pacearchaeota archaeon CG_4_9_14_0_2_um_filter_39_13]|nr:hypothetical protein [Candidatus Pacearchaeota archaeon]OIO42934.1 MAG: hypothetical protein AUJ64_03110 [Candidatus Pacearchaeota archaeon CG1_02_39_14]PJC45000.1 MAG: hypothetical protein CO038_00935 [Candidatus Pacearchaeota archaeon CG_4_9_14_0_2_um_filter_39_13]
MDRKGLSGIITVVLFVLLILVAIGIIWAFLNPFITEGTSGVGAIGNCLQVRLEAANCVDNTGSYSLTVRRGADDVTLSDVKLIFYDAQDNTEVKDILGDSIDTQIPDALGSRTYSNIILASLQSASKVGVSAVIISNDEEHTCEQVSELVDCE